MLHQDKFKNSPYKRNIVVSENMAECAMLALESDILGGILIEDVVNKPELKKNVSEFISLVAEEVISIAAGEVVFGGEMTIRSDEKFAFIDILPMSPMETTYLLVECIAQRLMQFSVIPDTKSKLEWLIPRIAQVVVHHTNRSYTGHLSDEDAPKFLEQAILDNLSRYDYRDHYREYTLAYHQVVFGQVAANIYAGFVGSNFRGISGTLSHCSTRIKEGLIDENTGEILPMEMITIPMALMFAKDGTHIDTAIQQIRAGSKSKMGKSLLAELGKYQEDPAGYEEQHGYTLEAIAGAVPLLTLLKERGFNQSQARTDLDLLLKVLEEPNSSIVMLVPNSDPAEKLSREEFIAEQSERVYARLKALKITRHGHPSQSTDLLGWVRVNIKELTTQFQQHEKSIETQLSTGEMVNRLFHELSIGAVASTAKTIAENIDGPIFAAMRETMVNRKLFLDSLLPDQKYPLSALMHQTDPDEWNSNAGLSRLEFLLFIWVNPVIGESNSKIIKKAARVEIVNNLTELAAEAGLPSLKEVQMALEEVSSIQVESENQLLAETLQWVRQLAGRERVTAAEKIKVEQLKNNFPRGEGARYNYDWDKALEQLEKAIKRHSAPSAEEIGSFTEEDYMEFACWAVLTEPMYRNLPQPILVERYCEWRKLNSTEA